MKICVNCNNKFENLKSYSNHRRYGCHFSEEFLQKQSVIKLIKHKEKLVRRKEFGQRRMAENNPHWKGNQIKTLPQLHNWVRRRLLPPDLCPNCHLKSKLDLANISPIYDKNTYNRELKNWRYLCRRCHMKEDGRMNNLGRRKGELNAN